MRKPRGIDEALRAAVARVGERVEQLEADLFERQSSSAAVVQGLRAAVDGLAPRLDDLQSAVARLRVDLGEDIDAAAERSQPLLRSLSDESAGRLDGLQGAVDLLAQRLGQSNIEVADDVRASLARLNEVAAAVASVGTRTDAVADGMARLVDDAGGRTQALLDAVAASSRESHERLRALHASLARRIEAAVAGAPGGPDGVAPAVAERLEALVRAVGTLRASVDAMPASVDSALSSVAHQAAEHQDGLTAALDRFRDAIEAQGGGLQRVHDSLQTVTATVDTGLERLRSSVGEGLQSVGRRGAAASKHLERVLAMLEDDRRGIEALHGLSQSLSSSLEQSTAMSGRVAELVLESRSAMRGDVERLESAVHLENVKQQQQAQAHLAQAVATIGDVVERESVVLSQRVSAVTAAVETIRTVLHAHVEDTVRAARTPRDPQSRPQPEAG
jgi:hypothetical protein